MGIRILDAATVGRIAAGEVVERPGSACKELMENALDAGATSITVELRGGGIEYLRVTDNGHGIAPEEVRLAFENHATSKLMDASDLMDVRTLGFRGEALPSIAAVAKVGCVTRRRAAASGAKLRVEGGRFVSLDEAGCPEGTTVTVEDLFYNVPARRAFLKKPAYEAAAVSEAVAALALANPGVAVRLIANGKTTLHSFGDGNLRHAALAVYGKEVAAALTDVDQMEGALRISGLVGVGDCARPTRSAQYFFINARVVKCPLLSQALGAACAGRVTIGMHPMAMLSLQLPPHAVDVNVHPNKLEVRFRDEAGVRAAVDQMLRRAFEGERLLDVEAATRRAEPLIQPSTLKIERVEVPGEQTEVDAKQVRAYARQTEVETFGASRNPEGRGGYSPPAPAPAEAPPLAPRDLRLNEAARAWPMTVSQVPSRPEPVAQQAEQLSAVPPPEETGAPRYRVIGVALDTYLLVEAKGSLILIDQHAAHERILYEQYAPRLDGPGASQPLLTPAVVPASPREIALVQENIDLLAEAGFEAEPFGERALAVRAVPFILGKADVPAFFLEMVSRLDQLKYAARDRRKGELIQMACKHAVKGGDRLSTDEIEALLQAMEDTRSPATCPHGRPVLRVLTQNELERMFKRQQ
ncbi:DNA mismatch repair endonuclease MutL [Bacillota bacterium Meth-B3]